MISSKLLPEIEADDNAKREQLLYGMQNLSIPAQIEKLKVICIVSLHNCDYLYFFI